MRKQRYSELECFTLGLIWQLGPCSPYDVRRHMASSPSTQWSASAGAIYPLMRRLQRARLLASKTSANGKRRRREYSITAAGVKALRTWIGPPLTPDAITVTYDPLRSRARFLAALTPAQRSRWLDAAEASLREVAERVRKWREVYDRKGDAGGDPFVPLISRHGELDVQARTQWLAEMRGVV